MPSAAGLRSGSSVARAGNTFKGLEGFEWFWRVLGDLLFGVMSRKNGGRKYL